MSQMSKEQEERTDALCERLLAGNESARAELAALPLDDLQCLAYGFRQWGEW